MHGIQVDSLRFRQLRRARGLTQHELARLAGVGERTVRNAETGQRVRLDFLRYLAIALGVDVTDVAHDNDEMRPALLGEKRIEHIMTAIECCVCEHDMSELIGLTSVSAVVRIPGAANVPFAG